MDADLLQGGSGSLLVMLAALHASIVRSIYRKKNTFVEGPCEDESEASV
jgi:hypothetical protein